MAGIDALRGFFPHTLLHFFFEVLRIVPNQYQINAVDELRIGLGVFGQNLSLFDEVNLDIQFF